MDEPVPVETEQPVQPASENAVPAIEPSATAPETAIPPESLRKIEGEIAGGVEGYQEAKRKALEPKTAAPVETAPAVAPAEPVVDEPVAPAPAATVEPPVAPVEPVVDDDDKTPGRIRIKGLPDAHLVDAANKIAREEKISFSEAFARVSPKPAEPAPASAAEPASTLRAKTAIDTDLAAAREERKAAAKAADMLEAGAATRMLEAEEKIESLRQEYDAVEEAEARAEQERQTTAEREFASKVSENQALAVKYWPEAKDKDSELSKLTVKLADQYEADPKLAHHAYEADALFFFTELAAKQLGILPVHLRPAAPATPIAPAVNGTPPKPPTPPAIKPQILNQRAVIRTPQPAATPASGAARTSQEPAIDPLGIDKIKNVADYDGVKEKLGLRR